MHTILYNTIDWHHTFCSGGMSYGLYCLLLHTFICCHNKYNNVCHISPPGPHCFKCSMARCINECNGLVGSFNADCKRKTTRVSKCFAVDSAKVVSYEKFFQGQKVFILIRVTVTCYQVASETLVITALFWYPCNITFICIYASLNPLTPRSD